jgi:NADH-ubiquinone oxidoreductase chain 5
MSIPLIILAIFSIFFGFICKDMFIGIGTGFFSDNGIFIHPTHEIIIETEFGVPILYKLLPLFLTISLFILYLLFAELYINKIVQFKYSKLGYNIYSLFNLRFYIELYYYYIYNYIFKLGSDTTKILDRGSVEYIGPYGLEISLIYTGNKAAKLDSGIVTSYALFILSGLIFYIFI